MVSPSRTYHRADAAAALPAPHYPTCGGCGEQCGKLARRCSSCGRMLYPSDAELDSVASRAMSAAPKREDSQSTWETGA